MAGGGAHKTDETIPLWRINNKEKKELIIKRKEKMQENTNKSRYFGSKIVINPRKLNKTHIDIYSTTNIQQ